MEPGFPRLSGRRKPMETGKRKLHKRQNCSPADVASSEWMEKLHELVLLFCFVCLLRRFSSSHAAMWGRIASCPTSSAEIPRHQELRRLGASSSVGMRLA